MPLTKPLNNNCLIEVIKDYADVARFDGDNASMSYGRLVEFSLDDYHLTASAAVEFSTGFKLEKAKQLSAIKGNIVRWEEFAEGGQTFEKDGKLYALIPFWRLIAVTEDQ